MTVGVVPGTGDDLAPVADTAAEAGRSVTVGSATEVTETDPAFVVAGDEPALLALVRAGCRAPILPINAGRGIRSVPATAASTAVANVIDGKSTIVEYPLIGVGAGTEVLGRALFDVTLMTSEPAHISEYELASNDGVVDRFRADGVVVATPAGSHGYAAAAGGPIIEPGSSVVSVVPVGSFVTRQVNWVLDSSHVAVSIARDESAVSLFVDGREVGPCSPAQRLELAADAKLSVLVVPESEPTFDS